MTENLIEERLKALRQTIEVKPAATPQPAVKVHWWSVKPKKTLTPQVVEDEGGDITWQPKAKKRRKVLCTIITQNRYWYEDIPLDTKGMDLSACTFDIYGKREPILIEDRSNGKTHLVPFHIPDAAGEPPNLVFIASRSACYKAFMAVPNDFLRKLQIGLMAALAFGVLFLIYILAQPPKVPPGAGA